MQETIDTIRVSVSVCAVAAHGWNRYRTMCVQTNARIVGIVSTVARQIALDGTVNARKLKLKCHSVSTKWAKSECSQSTHTETQSASQCERSVCILLYEHCMTFAFQYHIHIHNWRERYLQFWKKLPFMRTIPVISMEIHNTFLRLLAHHSFIPIVPANNHTNDIGLHYIFVSRCACHDSHELRHGHIACSPR